MEHPINLMVSRDGISKNEAKRIYELQLDEFNAILEEPGVSYCDLSDFLLGEGYDADYMEHFLSAAGGIV